MRFVLFYHSLISDWNHGNAHFLRGVVSELKARGHEVEVFEPHDAWSVVNLIAEHGEQPIDEFRDAYPDLTSTRYSLDDLDLDRVLDGADVVIVHEWNSHDLVRRLGEHRRLRTGYRLLFHDTHHRSVTAPEEMAAYDLSNYDGVLAFGETIRQIYLDDGWAERAWTWHEAADTRIFHPRDSESDSRGDVVWIGNWGDGERTGELREYLIEPVRALRIDALVHGVRYPDDAIDILADAGIRYGGWLPNYRVPEVFAQYRVTVHIPRRPYVEALPGIPTIRMFEALACGIPLVSAPWNDWERLFTRGADYLVASDGDEMRRLLRAILNDPEIAHEIGDSGRRSVLRRHTCAHRVDELLGICAEIGIPDAVDVAA